MKKLVLLVLFSTFMSLSSLSQVIIKVAGTPEVLRISQQVEGSLEYLDIREPMHLYIVFSEQMPTHLKGITYSVEAADSVKLIRVRINARLDKKQCINILAHEMIHVKQFVEGDLRMGRNQKVHWKGKKYYCKNPTARKNPWEREAYRYDQYLAKVLNEMPREKLLASESGK